MSLHRVKVRQAKCELKANTDRDVPCENYCDGVCRYCYQDNHGPLDQAVSTAATLDCIVCRPLSLARSVEQIAINCAQELSRLVINSIELAHTRVPDFPR